MHLRTMQRSYWIWSYVWCYEMQWNVSCSHRPGYYTLVISLVANLLFLYFIFLIRSNCLGYTLPKTFLSDQQDYACTTCAAVVPYEKVEEMLERIGIHLSKIEKNNISACERFLNCYKNVLHPNHFYNIDATIALAQLIGQQDGLQAVDENMLADKIELCKKLDNILKVLTPGNYTHA